MWSQKKASSACNPRKRTFRMLFGEVGCCGRWVFWWLGCWVVWVSLWNGAWLMDAHFSDRGHLFRRDRGRRFRAIVDAQGMRASEGLNVSQGPERCPAGHREAWHQWSFNCSGSRKVPPLRAMR